MSKVHVDRVYEHLVRYPRAIDRMPHDPHLGVAQERLRKRRIRVAEADKLARQLIPNKAAQECEE